MTLSTLSDISSPERRDAIALLLGGTLAAVVPAAATAQGATSPTRPVVSDADMLVVDARFPAEMAPGVFVLPDKRIPLVPNVGIVVGRDTALVIDCGLGLDSAEAVLALTRRLAPGRRIVLTVTHAHPEHGFGAQVFKRDGRIIYNRAQADYFTRTGQTLLDGFRSSILSPGQRQALDGVVVTPPDEAFDGERASIDLGGRRVDMRTWGVAHSPGDQVVHLPEEGIVFAGDLLEERMFPIVPFFPPMIGAADIDVARWEMVLADILGLRPRIIVPGHGNLGGPEIAMDVLGYFRQVREMVRLAGGSTDGLEARIRALHPTWEQSQFIGPALRWFSERRA